MSDAAVVTISADTSQARAAIDRCERMGRSIVGGLRQTVEMIALQVQAAAQKLAPHEEGTLERSGHTDVQVQGVVAFADVTFGGMAAAYAEVQHERTDFTHEPGRMHHYLYGDEHSAWNSQAERSSAETIDAQAERLAEERLGRKP